MFSKLQAYFACWNLVSDSNGCLFQGFPGDRGQDGPKGSRGESSVAEMLPGDPGTV